MDVKFNPTINKYVDIISNINSVLKVYLFGSQAKGTAHEDSDIDLMVIIENNADVKKITFQIQKSLSDRIIPLDVMVNREAEFYNAHELTLQKQIASEGVVMYAK